MSLWWEPQIHEYLSPVHTIEYKAFACVYDSPSSNEHIFNSNTKKLGKDGKELDVTKDDRKWKPVTKPAY